MYIVATSEDLGAAVRAERRRQRLTQQAVAEHSGTTRQWLIQLERGHAQAEAGIVLAVLATLGMAVQHASTRHAGVDGSGDTWLTASDLARAVRRELNRKERAFALALVGRALRDLRDVAEPGRRSETLAPPPSTGDHRWDALISGAYEYGARRAGLDAPDWVMGPPLDHPWYPDDDPILRDWIERSAPTEMRSRNVLLAARELEPA